MEKTYSFQTTKIIGYRLSVIALLIAFLCVMHTNILVEFIVLGACLLIGFKYPKQIQMLLFKESNSAYYKYISAMYILIILGELYAIVAVVS